MLYKKCKAVGGLQGVGWWALCLCGFLLVFTVVAWMTYGQFEFALDPALWGICFVIGLTATAVWVIFVDGPKPLLFRILRGVVAILRITTSLTKTLAILAIAGVALILVTTVLIQLFYHELHVSELPFVLLTGFPDVYMEAIQTIGAIVALLGCVMALGAGSSDPPGYENHELYKRAYWNRSSRQW